MTREEAIKTLQELWRETNDSWYEEVYNMAIEALQVEPTTGKWIRVDEKPYFRKHFHKVCCSNCNEEGYKKWNYCPNCGQRCKR